MRLARSSRLSPGQPTVGYRVEYQEVQRVRGSWILLSVYLFLVVPYLAWRTSIVNWHIWYGPLVLVAELYNALMAALFLWITRVISAPIHRPTRLDRVVDVLVPTYNEPLAIIEPTVRAARAIKGVRQVLLLDDGNRPEVRQLAKALGIAYHARSSNQHGKAGNLNNGLQFTDAEFIACFDADHIAEPNFLERTLGYFDDSQVAFVQTPQTFYNRQSFLFRTTRRGLWSEQGTFYEVVQPAKNRFNAAFFVGTCAILRRQAVDSVGGFATGTVTEDIHTSVRLHAAGWKSVYVPEPLAYGLEADTFSDFVRQRRRWASGGLTLLFRTPDSPLWVEGLSLKQRLNYVGSTLAHVLGAQKLFYFLLPILCTLTFTSPVTVSWSLAFAAIMAFASYSIFLTYRFGRGTYHLLYTEAYNLSNLVPHLGGLWGIIKIQRRFIVSRKGGGGSERSWLKLIWWGLLGVDFIVLVRAADLLSSASVQHSSRFDLLLIGALFMVYNLAILLTFFAYLLKCEGRSDEGRPDAQWSPQPAGQQRYRPAFFEHLSAAEKHLDSPSGLAQGKSATIVANESN